VDASIAALFDAALDLLGDANCWEAGIERWAPAMPWRHLVSPGGVSLGNK